MPPRATPVATVPWVKAYETGIAFFIHSSESVMSTSLTVKPSGTTDRVALPQSVLDAMGLREGDQLAIVHEADGSVHLVPMSSSDAAALENAQVFMESHADAFQALAS